MIPDSRARIPLTIGVITLVALGLWFSRTWRDKRPAMAPLSQSEERSADERRLGEHGSPQPRPPFALSLPSGFDITLYASGLKKPRVLTLDSGGTPLVSDMEAGTVLALPDRNEDGVAEEPIVVLKGLRRPHGMAFREHALYVAEEDAVTRYTYDPASHSTTDPQKLLDLPAGDGHFTRTIGFGLDGMLYVSTGSSCNVCRERDERRAAILRVNPDGGATERWAWGLRNTVFFTFHPETGAMLGNDMGRDFLGDDLPPDELNVITGGDYGWPYCYGKQASDPFGKHPQGCETTQPSLFDYPAHVAPLGLRFIPKAFSEDVAGDILVALHGSWNRSTPVGYKVVRLHIVGDRVVGQEDFLTGFPGETGRAQGRPVDLLFLPDGALLISDDHAGVIYRVVSTP